MPSFASPTRNTAKQIPSEARQKICILFSFHFLYTPTDLKVKGINKKTSKSRDIYLIPTFDILSGGDFFI